MSSGRATLLVREGIDAAAATDDRRMRLRAVVFLALSAALVAYAVTL